MTPLPFNGPLFAHDFILALDRAEKASRHGRPHFNERSWFRCLAEADEHDNARRLTSSYQTQDLAQHRARTSNYFERLYSSPGPKMNGKLLHLSASDPEFRTLHAIRAAEA
jgi:hypothetical protein